MTWTNRIIWQEGMFLRAQHFQQQDRHFHHLLRSRTAALRPHPWGLTELTVDPGLLAAGRFAVTSAAGVFQDGTPFAIPHDADHPPPLELSTGVRNALVLLALPVLQAGAVEVALDATAIRRYATRGFDAYDTQSGSPQPAELQ